MSVLDAERLRPCCGACSTPTEFLSDYGIRALSRYHLEHPYVFDGGRARAFVVKYLPAESDSRLFGGNSNWRGPIWFPVNYMIVRSLHEFWPYLRRQSQGRVPHRLGQMMNSRRSRRDDRPAARRRFSCATRSTAGGERCGAITNISRPTPIGATTCRSTSISTATRARASERAIKPAGRRWWFRCFTNTGTQHGRSRTSAGPLVSHRSDRAAPTASTSASTAKHATGGRAAAVRSRGRCTRQRRRSCSIPQRNRTYDYWHVFVPGVAAGQLYGYRVYGPEQPGRRAAVRSAETARGSVRARGGEHRELRAGERRHRPGRQHGRRHEVRRRRSRRSTTGRATCRSSGRSSIR